MEVFEYIQENFNKQKYLTFFKYAFDFDAIFSLEEIFSSFVHDEKFEKIITKQDKEVASKLFD